MFFNPGKPKDPIDVYQKYSNIISNNGNPVLAGNTWTTVYQISGEGLIYTATATISGYVAALRLTLDGTVVFYGITSTSGNITGILQASDRSNNGFATPIGDALLPSAGYDAYPFTAGTLGACVLETPLYFSSSVKMEVMNKQASSFSTQWGIGGLLA